MNSRIPYQPVNCGLYDYLEMWSIKKTLVTIEFLRGTQKVLLTDQLISNLQTKNKEEFVILNSGNRIRLDKIIRINDIDFTQRVC